METGPPYGVRPELKGGRVALDTGAYATGRLTCLAVSSDEKNLEFLTAAQNASGIISGGVFSSTAVVERHTAREHSQERRRLAARPA